MSVAAPTEMNVTFASAYNARDAERLCDLYAPDGAVVEIDGTLSIGSRAIRVHITGLLQIGGVMESINTYSHVNGDLALIGARWTIRFDDGRPDISGRSAEVLRRDDDGWRYLIDHPAAD